MPLNKLAPDWLGTLIYTYNFHPVKLANSLNKTCLVSGNNNGQKCANTHLEYPQLWSAWYASLCKESRTTTCYYSPVTHPNISSFHSQTPATEIKTQGLVITPTKQTLDAWLVSWWSHLNNCLHLNGIWLCTISATMVQRYFPSLTWIPKNTSSFLF